MAGICKLIYMSPVTPLAILVSTELATKAIIIR